MNVCAARRRPPSHRISARTPAAPKRHSDMAPPTSTAKQSPVNMLNKKVMRLAVGAEFAEKLAEDALQLGSETKLRGTEVPPCTPP